METQLTPIADCVEIQQRPHSDERGTFTKVFQHSVAIGTDAPAFELAELFWSTSKRGVFRGMHFQLPPHDVAKLVWCTDGSIRDFVVDLRVDSPTFRHSHSVELTGSNGVSVYVPPGCAHGFLTLASSATVCYAQNGEFDATSDAGIHWSSVGSMIQNPDVMTLSERDAHHPYLEDFVSPFTLSRAPDFVSE